MSENKDTLKDLFNRLTLQEQNNVINFAYLYDDIRGLRKELQQKENIIKEVREYIEKELKSGRSKDNQWLMGCYDEDKKILEILDKVGDNNE